MKLSCSQKRIIELFFLFIFYPIFLGITSIPLYARLSFAPFIACYLLYLSYKHRVILFKNKKQVQPQKFWKKLSFNLVIIATVTIVYILNTNANLLFNPILHQPLLWAKMIVVYLFFSVLPQEYIYRVFYFNRYQFLFKNQQVFFFVNAFLFSIAHFMFNSTLVLFITFIGGYLFAYTYSKTKSMLWISIEHLIYGSWLFTVGMGKMLGFPI